MKIIYPSPPSNPVFDRTSWRPVLEGELPNYEIVKLYLFGSLSLSTLKSEYPENYTKYEKKAVKLILDSLTHVPFPRIKEIIKNTPKEKYISAEVPFVYQIDEAIFTLLSLIRTDSYSCKDVANYLPCCKTKTDGNLGKRGTSQSNFLAMLDLAIVYTDGSNANKIMISPLGQEFLKMPMLHRVVIAKKLILRIAIIRNLIRESIVDNETISDELSSVYKLSSVNRSIQPIYKLWHEFDTMGSG